MISQLEVLKRNNLLSLKLQLLKGHYRHTTDQDTWKILYQIIGPLSGPHKAVYLGTLPGSLHFLFQAAPRGSTVSNIEANAWGHLPAPGSSRQSLTQALPFTELQEQLSGVSRDSKPEGGLLPLAPAHITLQTQGWHLLARHSSTAWMLLIWFGAGRKPLPRQRCTSGPRDTD